MPVLLSVGYAACHWCHVMAHESFEDEATAAQMNADFVCIKVDREERPDIDAIYMNATVAMTRQVVADDVFAADGAPFFAAPYPLTPRGGQPSFRQVLTAITEVWTQRRDEVAEVGDQVRKHLSDNVSALPFAGRGSTTLCSTPRSPRSWPTTIRSRAVSGGRPSFRRRRCSKGCCGTVNGPRRGRGTRRSVPARRWRGAASTTNSAAVRPVRRRQRLGGTAFREDAVRQRATVAGLRTPGRAPRVTLWRCG